MDARLFQEAIRSATVTYPIPFMVAILLLFAVLCFGGSSLVDDWMRVLLAVSGVAALGTAIGSYVYALWSRPELLRSERHQEIIRAIDVLGDPGLSRTDRTQMVAGVLELTGRPKHHPPTRAGENSD